MISQRFIEQPLSLHHVVYIDMCFYINTVFYICVYIQMYVYIYIYQGSFLVEACCWVGFPFPWYLDLPHNQLVLFLLMVFGFWVNYFGWPVRFPKCLAPETATQIFSKKLEDPSNHPILECICCPGCRNFQVPKSNRLSESKRRRTYAGGPDGYRPVGTAMEGYRGGIGAVSPPVTWESWFRMPVLFFWRIRW